MVVKLYQILTHFENKTAYAHSRLKKETLREENAHPTNFKKKGISRASK